jgi:hypothetical protein
MGGVTALPVVAVDTPVRYLQQAFRVNVRQVYSTRTVELTLWDLVEEGLHRTLGPSQR